MVRRRRVRWAASWAVPIVVGVSLQAAGQTRSEPAVRSTSPELGVVARRHEKAGILISEVRANSPAEKAGLVAGDVISEFGPTTFHKEGDSRYEFFDAVGSSPVEKGIRVVFARGGERHVTYVRLVERPSLGITWAAGEQGYVVRRVREGGLAASVGMRPGDVILGFGNEMPVKDLAAAIDKSAFGVAIPITFRREGEKIVKEVTFRPQGPSIHVSSAQEYVLTQFGEPESFSLYFVADREGSEKTVRGETWDYYSLGKSFVFLNGKLISSERLEPLGAEAVFAAHRPWQFDEDTTIEDVVSLMPDKAFVKVELAAELIEGGVMYYSEQLSLGFKDDGLVFVKSIPLVAGKEDSR